MDWAAAVLEIVSIACSSRFFLFFAMAILAPSAAIYAEWATMENNEIMTRQSRQLL